MTVPSLPQASRILSLEGGCNFRDLGGYRTRAGRELLRGKVYRAGVLSYFTSKDEQQLRQRGVRIICDLRRADERRREPTRWPDSGVQQLSWDDGDAPPTIRSIVADHGHPYTAAGVHAATIDMYRALTTWMAPRIRGMFQCIARGDVPLVVHCAAGKDRTGIAIALLLAALDVPHATIMEDYLLTNEACDIVQFMLTQHEAHLGVVADQHPVLTLPEDIRRVLFTAHADYLQGAFDKISHDHEDVFGYLRTQVGVDHALLGEVQSVLLTGD